MAIRDIFKINRKTFFNPTAWLDVENLKRQGSILYRILRGSFTTLQPTYRETFEEAKKRLNLNEATLKALLTRYRIYTVIFVIIGLVTFTYAIYLLFAYHEFFGCLLGLAVAALFFSQAFRFDFWAYQIKRRKLGVTFNEWYRSVMGEKGDQS